MTTGLDEPLSDASVERRIRAMYQVVVPLIDDGDEITLRDVADRASSHNVGVVVTAPAPPGRRRGWASLAAAAAAGVAAGAGLMAVADRDTDHITVPAATTVPLAGPDPDMFGLANGCASAHGRNPLDEPIDAVLFAPTGSAPNGIWWCPSKTCSSRAACRRTVTPC